jgi:hypothetical protein
VTQRFLSCGSVKWNTCLLHIVASQQTWVALNPYQVIQISTRISQFSLSQQYLVVRNLHNLESLTPYMSHPDLRDKAGCISYMRQRRQCRCFGSDRTPGVAPQGVFRSRTVSPTVAKWFVPDARGVTPYVLVSMLGE